MSSTLQNLRDSALMRKAALKYIKLETSTERSTLENANYVKGIYKDAADLHIIGDLIESGDMIKAKAAAKKLDSIVREYIPAHVWQRFRDTK